MKENNLLMPFIDESESFTNGFECGQIWEKLQFIKELNMHGSRIKDYLIHLENSAQIQAICDHFEVKCFITALNEEWANLTTHYIDENDAE
jgi:hypothetical protein